MIPNHIKSFCNFSSQKWQR